mmetsp:Transcript_14249/g.40561  ORF Transcript_14249/g.40561 Transcript_14249/m.40561 type:complete len:601 (-) Transcript_14249:60-1862(-)
MSQPNSFDQLRLDVFGGDSDEEPNYDHLLPPSQQQEQQSPRAAQLEVPSVAAASPTVDHRASPPPARSTAAAATNNDSMWHKNEGKPKSGTMEIPTETSNDTGDEAASTTHDNVLGTLIVRVVAARGLQLIQRNESNRGGLFSVANRFGGGSSTSTPMNPYASVKFGNSTQRTSEVFNTTEPVWPRHENMFLDVSLPVDRLTHRAFADSGEEKGEEDDDCYVAPNSMLTVAIFTGNGTGKGKQKNDKHTPKKVTGDSDDTFLGMASIDVIHLLTGTSTILDQWIPLTGVASSQGRVRITCEYETNELMLRAGDVCRFTQFCRPEDLFPLLPHGRYQVSAVNGDSVQLSYKTQEGWICSFQVNRFMVVCVENSSNPVQICQEELASISERLSHSMVADSLATAIDRVPVDGLLSISSEAVKGGLAVFGRWFNGGIDLAVSDIARATNWHGEFSPQTSMSLDDPIDSHGDRGNNVNGGSDAGQSHTIEDVRQEVSSMLDLDTTLRLEPHQDAPTKALPNMPPCPITGEPMIEPVVAADGHTYERTAIHRWLTTSNKSPLTGSVLAHKNLVPNYGLISSVESLTRDESESVEAAVAQTTANNE